MSQALIISGLTELAKLALQSYLNYAKMAGKTPEEIDQMWEDEKARFAANHPDTLPDV